MQPHTVNTQDLVPWLNMLADGAGEVAKNVPGTAGMVAGIVAAAARFASDLVKQGINPVEHIERIHAADDSLAGIEGAWAQKLREKFGAPNQT